MYSRACSSQVVGQALHIPRAAQRVHNVCRSTLVGQYLLGAQGELSRLFGRQGQRLVPGIHVERLGASQYGGQGLHGAANDVVVGLLGREGNSCRLCVEAQHHGARVLGAESVTHYPGPHAPGRPELGDLFEQGCSAIRRKRTAGARNRQPSVPHPAPPARTRWRWRR